DKATRYHRSKRRASTLSLAWGVALLAGSLATGVSASLRSLAESFAPSPASFWFRPVAVVVYVTLLTLVNEVGGVPLAFFSGFVLERRYGLSNERLGAWLRDQAKSFAIGVVLASLAAVLVYALIAWSPRWWWLAAGVSFAVVIVGLAQLTPIVLLPLF